MIRAPLLAVALLLPALALGQGRIDRDLGAQVPEFEGPEADARDTVTIARTLDKVTARITELELPEDEPVAFGSLLITARHCESRPPEEPPETFAFLEIDSLQDGERERIFTGWMVESSPALHALEHPVYDVWIIGCRVEDLPPLPADQGVQTDEPPGR